MEKRQSYRETINRIYREKGYVVIDPWEREKIIYRNLVKASMVNFNFIQRGLEDIKNCDILVAYMPKLSAGTCMELFYAKHMGKRTICICRIKNPSPWIVAHSDKMISRIDELRNILRNQHFWWRILNCFLK